MPVPFELTTLLALARLTLGPAVAVAARRKIVHSYMLDPDRTAYEQALAFAQDVRDRWGPYEASFTNPLLSTIPPIGRTIAHDQDQLTRHQVPLQFYDDSLLISTVDSVSIKVRWVIVKLASQNSWQKFGVSRGFIDSQENELMPSLRGRIKEQLIKPKLTQELDWFYKRLGANSHVMCWGLGTGIHTTCFKVSSGNRFRLDIRAHVDAAIALLVGVGKGELALHSTLERDNSRLFLGNLRITKSPLSPIEFNDMQVALVHRHDQIRNTVHQKSSELTAGLVAGWDD